MAEPVTVLDRRQRRRQESIEEILDVAVELMAEHGVGGLSLGEVARQLGIRPPSLYVYFTSKSALYDALFARGSREVLATMTQASTKLIEDGETLEEVLLGAARVMVRWSVDNPVYSQLLFWRPVPGFEPTAESYKSAVELMELTSSVFGQLQQRRWLRNDVPLDEIIRDWTIVIAGVVSQQLSNAPDEDFEAGRFTAALPNVVAMFVREYATPSSPKTTKTPPAATRRTSREHQR